MAAGAAGAAFVRLVKALEYGVELVFDIGQMEVLFVDLGIAALAEPHQGILLMGKAFPFDHQTDGIRHALGGMRNMRWQVEHFTGFDRDVARTAVFLDAQDHFTFDLVEKLRTVLEVVIRAFIRAADDHHDVIGIDDAFVADRRLQKMPVLLDPFMEIEGRCQHVMSLRWRCI